MTTIDQCAGDDLDQTTYLSAVAVQEPQTPVSAPVAIATRCTTCGCDVEDIHSPCANCAWLKSVEEFVDPEAAQPAAAVIPETAGPAREALLQEPMVHIHSLSDHDGIPPDDEFFSARPVIAECNERHFPKDDLLTPRDLANAFKIEFEDDAQRNRPLATARRAARKAKLGLAGSAAIAVGFLIGMQGIRMLANHLNAPVPQVATASGSTRAELPPMDPVVSADAKMTAAILASAVQPPTEKKPIEIIPAVKPPVAPVASEKIPGARPTDNAVAAAPVHSPNVMPVMMVDPAATQAVEDNPKVLLDAGLAAESSGNFAAAVGYYERIKSLPSSQWPAHLDTRLQLAREELKGGLR